MPQASERRAIGLMLSALCFLILLDASGKWLGMKGFPVAAITWWRYLGHMLLVLALFLPSRGMAVLRTTSLKRQALRGATMVLISLLYFAALREMPLAQATAIFFTTPMMTTLFATIFLRERPGLSIWLSIIAGFVGVLIVIRPGGDLPLTGSLLVLGAAAANGAYQTLTRAQALADPPEVQVLYAGLAGAAVMTLALPAWWEPGWWASPAFSAFDWLVFALIGVVGALGHLLLARAFSLAPASRLSPWTYSQMLLSIALGWAVFGSTPDAVALIGMVVIALSPQIVWLFRKPGLTR
jgi:drug/metabolite transporter (DMT)-like permease